MVVGKLNVLLIEDDESDAIIFKNYLANTPYNVSHVSSVLSAFEATQNTNYDIIFLDYCMPDSDGLFTLNELRGKNPSTPIVILTGLDDDELAHSLLGGGAQDYLLKHDVNQRLILRSIHYSIERAKSTTEIYEAKLKAEKSLQLMDELIAVVSHDLRSPLGTIVGLSEVFEALEDDMIATKGRDFVKRIKKQANYCLEFTKSLLDLTKLEQGVSLKPSEFKIKKLVEESLATLEMALKDKNISIHLDMDDDYQVFLDYDKVLQVLNNIIGNAIKYSYNDSLVGINISTSLSNKVTEKNSDTLVIVVKDYGPGIPQNKLKSIFNKFEQVCVKDQKKGSGLGLAICKNICTLHKGSIKAKSKLGKGAQFIITFPNVVRRPFTPAHRLMTSSASRTHQVYH